MGQECINGKRNGCHPAIRPIACVPSPPAVSPLLGSSPGTCRTIDALNSGAVASRRPVAAAGHAQGLGWPLLGKWSIVPSSPIMPWRPTLPSGTAAPPRRCGHPARAGQPTGASDDKSRQLAEARASLVILQAAPLGWCSRAGWWQSVRSHDRGEDRSDIITMAQNLWRQKMRIINMRNEIPHGDAIRIDRQTRWGNPFRIGTDGSRHEVIAKYRKHLFAQVQSGKITLEDLADLHGRDLACWCAPAPCHGEVLVKASLWAKFQLRNQK